MLIFLLQFSCTAKSKKTDYECTFWCYPEFGENNSEEIWKKIYEESIYDDLCLDVNRLRIENNNAKNNLTNKMEITEFSRENNAETTPVNVENYDNSMQQMREKRKRRAQPEETIFPSAKKLAKLDLEDKKSTQNQELLLESEKKDAELTEKKRGKTVKNTASMWNEVKRDLLKRINWRKRASADLNNLITKLKTKLRPHRNVKEEFKKVQKRVEKFFQRFSGNQIKKESKWIEFLNKKNKLGIFKPLESGEYRKVVFYSEEEKIKNKEQVGTAESQPGTAILIFETEDEKADSRFTEFYLSERLENLRFA